MSDEAKDKALADIVTLRPVDIDDLSEVRHLHAEAFHTLSADVHTDEEIAAFVALIYSPSYTDVIVGTACYGAWIDDQLVATCGWTPADDEVPTARISDLYVHPLFAGMGLARMLVTYAERRAAEAGYEQYSVRVSVNAVPVFEQFGYETTSHGVRQVTEDVSLPVVFMRRTPTQSSATIH